jgi:hypothetical protein
MGGGLVPGGRVPGEGLGGGVPGVLALIGGGLVPGGRVPGEGLGGGVPGVPARIIGTVRCRDEANCCWSSCLVMLSPKTPRARSAMISPTVRVIASATSLPGALVWVCVRCNRLASRFLSGALRMRSSHNREPERLSIISRAVIGLLPAEKTLIQEPGSPGSEGELKLAKKDAKGKY